MRMDTSIRVKTEKKHRMLYRELTSTVVGDSHELFFICACLGYRRKRALPLGKRGDDRFWSSTITPEEWTAFYAMLLEDRGMDFAAVQDEKELLARIEEYANGGMQILLEECLDGYITDSGENISLVASASKELPKVLLQFVYEQAASKETARP
jgi:hypothetical protein